MVCVSMCPFRITLKLSGGTGKVLTWQRVAVIRACGFRTHRYGTVSYRNLFPAAYCDLGHIYPWSPCTSRCAALAMVPNGRAACLSRRLRRDVGQPEQAGLRVDDQGQRDRGVLADQLGRDRGGAVARLEGADADGAGKDGGH